MGHKRRAEYRHGSARHCHERGEERSIAEKLKQGLEQIRRKERRLRKVMLQRFGCRKHLRFWTSAICLQVYECFSAATSSDIFPSTMRQIFMGFDSFNASGRLLSGKPW